MKSLLHLLLCLLFILPLSAETQVSISSSTNLANLGDWVNLKVIVKTTEQFDEINVVMEKQHFELITQQPMRRQEQADFVVYEKDLTVAFFKTGDFTIGPLMVEMKRGNRVVEEKTTNSLSVTIESILTKEDKDIKPLKDLVAVKGNPFYLLKWLFFLLAAGLIVFLVIWWIHKLRNKPAQTVEQVLSPLQELDNNLQELLNLKLFEKGKTMEFFIRLIRVIKLFFQRNFNFNAEDFTTYETLYTLRRYEADQSILDHMDIIFNAADLVKFAKYPADKKIYYDVVTRVRTVLDSYQKQQQRFEEKSET